MFRLSLKNKYDVILVRDKIISSLFFILVSKICRSKFVFWLSFPFPEAQIFHFPMTRNLKSLIIGLLRWIALYKFVLLNSDLILVRSEEMKKMIIRKSKIDAKKVISIPPAIDLNVFLELEKENVASCNFSIKSFRRKKYYI